MIDKQPTFYSIPVQLKQINIFILKYKMI